MKDLTKGVSELKFWTRWENEVTSLKLLDTGYYLLFHPSLIVCLFLRHKTFIGMGLSFHCDKWCTGSHLNFSSSFSFPVPPFPGLAKSIKNNQKNPNNPKNPTTQKTPQPPPLKQNTTNQVKLPITKEIKPQELIKSFAL